MQRRVLWAAVAAAAFVAFILVKEDQFGLNEETQMSPSPSASASKTPTPGVIKKASPTPSASGQAGTVTYSQLVEQYAGKRIQFDQYCQANPSRPSYSNGTSIMLDNRSGDARTITVGGVAYSLGGYGYRIVKLQSSSLPKTLSLNCGAAVNVGEILIQ